MGFMSPKAPKMPPPPKPPKPIPPKAELVTTSEETGTSNFEEELRKRQKRKQTVMAGETGGYGGRTQLG